MYNCKFCGKEFNTANALAGHCRWCKEIKKEIVKICPKCGKEFILTRKIDKNGVEKIPKKEKIFCSCSCANKRPQSDETKRKLSLNANPWNKGKFKYTPKFCKICNKKLTYHNKTGYCKTHYIESGLSKKILKGKCGGHRKNSGLGKYGYYKGIWCQSTYELAYVIWCIDHNIDIKRNWKYFEYVNSKNRKTKYYPDFYINDKFIEIKGYNFIDLDLKIQAVQNKSFTCEVLTEKELKPIFEYVKKKYQITDFTLLYDNSKPKFKYICCVCNKEFFTNSKRKSNNICCSRSCAGKMISYRNNKKIKGEYDFTIDGDIYICNFCGFKTSKYGIKGHIKNKHFL